MDIKRYRYFGISVLVLIFIVVLFKFVHYVENEGFNPTDEGVVLAQSWRLVNGQIPHKDFVSIRPAVSGFLHTINFVIPGALVSNARWFVLLQFFLIAAVMSGFLFSIINKSRIEKLGGMYFAALLISGFTITVLNYNLYSWTTIDAVFWSVMALPLVLSKKRWQIALGLFFTSLAALSRQTFAVICLAGFVYVFIKNRKQFVKYLLIFILGALPFVFYLIMLLVNNALPDFISQMTGRTEFFETAILQFIKKFVVSLSLPLNIVCLFICVFLYLKRKSGLVEMFIERKLHVLLAIAYLLFAIFVPIKHFIKSEIDIYSLPFDLFYLSLFFMVFHYLILPEHKKLRLVMLSVLIISWTSAISLGDNSPVFASGILFISLIVLCFDVLSDASTKTKNIITNRYVLMFLAIGIFVLGLYSQPRVNYRDLSFNKLEDGLNESSKNFGDIKTNGNLVDYYNELTAIYESLDSSLNRTIVFPNNAMFYPLMRTKNPSSLDWLNYYEYVGQEDRIRAEFMVLMAEPKMYFIVDKIDLRLLKDGLVAKEYNQMDIVFDMINENCKILPIESEYFTVYTTID